MIALVSYSCVRLITRGQWAPGEVQYWNASQGGDVRL